jgi:carboxylate-amine ligase
MSVTDPDKSVLPTGFDEDRDDAGEPRPGYAETIEALAGIDLDRLRRTVAETLGQRGVSFGPDPFVVDPVPRLIAGDVWDPLADGLAQRARALNCFLRDAYGERRIVEAGVVELEGIERAEGYEPDLLGRLPPSGSPAAIIGFDLVRDPEGCFLVLEDNLRTPSGFAYALAAREALEAALPPGLPPPRPLEAITAKLLRGAIGAAAPEGCEDPLVVVLGDGPDNSAHYEHARAADLLGGHLVTVDDLAREGEDLHVRLPDGTSRRVDVVYRRTDDDRLRGDDGELTAVADLLLEPWCNGRIGLVNAFGNGLADDKLAHSRVEDFVRFYLGEEPKVRSVPTLALTTTQEVDDAVGRLRELVVKPRYGQGGAGVVIGAHAEDADLERLAGELRERPEDFIAQPIVALSRHPTVIDGELRPRHVDLRPFAFCGADDAVALLPGGLTRVALDAGALVVNSSQNGGGKDTWVFDR